MNEYSIEVCRVVDGDTIVVDVSLGFGVTYSSCYLRLLGINAPERGSVGAALATEFLERFIDAGKVATAKTTKKDKYGRHIADVLVDGKSASEALLQAGLVGVYKK
jgi:micrococcal nuclease